MKRIILFLSILLVSQSAQAADLMDSKWYKDRAGAIESVEILPCGDKTVDDCLSEILESAMYSDMGWEVNPMNGGHEVKRMLLWHDGTGKLVVYIWFSGPDGVATPLNEIAVKLGKVKRKKKDSASDPGRYRY